MTEPDSCWGCGTDWSIFWTPSDLIKIKIYNIDEFVCPDCFEEIPEDAIKEEIK